MPAGQTIITYNGITITNCVTEQFSQDAVFDDSGTDLLFHKFTIEATGFISGHGPTSAGLRNSVDGPTSVISPADPAYQEVAIRAALLEPRKEFTMRVGGTFSNTGISGGTLLLRVMPYQQTTGPTPLASWKSASPGSPPGLPGNPVVGDRGGYDLNNGPKCLSVSLTQITGNTLFRVRVRFEVCKLECDQHGQAIRNNSGVLSNRWSVADDIDENFMTTRRFQGVLRVMTANVNAHEFRTLVVPPLQPGFYRKSMAFNVSEDGLKLAYTVIDRETVWSAPKPATKWYLSHKETTGGSTAMCIGEATCQLWGDRNTDDQRVLLKTALSVVQSKLFFAGGPETIPQELTATTEYGSDSHTVIVYMRVMRPLVLHQFMGMMHETLGTGLSPANPFIAASPAAGYDPNKSRGSRPGDKIEVSGPLEITTAWRAYLQSPCDEEHALDLARNATPETPKGIDVEYTLNVSPSSSIPDTPLGYINPEHETFPYTYWDMQSLYTSQQNRVAMPIARSSNYLPAQATQAVATLSPPTWRRVIRCSGIRVGKEPAMPKFPVSYTLPGPGTGRKATMVGDKKISVHPPTKTLDGKNMYRIDVDLEYALTHEPQPTDSLPVGFLPWQNNSIGYKLPASSFSVAPVTAGIS